MKHILLLFSLLFTFTLLSCQDDVDRDNRTGKGNFQLSYTIPGATSVITRSDVTIVEGEDQINSFYILFFENDAEGAGEFVAAIDLKEYHQGTLPNSGILEIELPKSSGLSDKNAYKILVCANIEAYHPSIENLAGLEAFCQGRTEQQVKQSLQPQVEGVTSGVSADEEQADDSHQMEAGNLPMSASIVKQAGQSQVAVNLVRAVSRFDVVNQVSGYELESASLWNAATSTLLWDEAGTNFSGSHTRRYYGVSATGNRITGGLYSFENFVEQSIQNDTKTTALVIGMLNIETGLTEYFRTNIYALDKSQKLKRNNVYTSTIREVIGTGFRTEREAYESDEDLLVSDINGWTTELGDNVVYDEDNVLAVPTSTISLAMAGDIRTYNIFTQGEGTLQLTTEEIPVDVKVRLDGNKLSIEAPASRTEWVGVLTFSIGRLTTSIQIQQAEYINNYLTLNFGVEDLPLFDFKAGSISPEIEVMSTGAWVAKIYSGNGYFSFDSSASPVIVKNGEANTGFTVRALKENKTTASRYCFLHVSLVEFPEINQVVVLEQAKYEEYIRFNPDYWYLPATQQTVSHITLESNADWDLYVWLNPWGGPVRFYDNYQLKDDLTGSGDKPLTIIVPENDGDVEKVIYIIAETKSGKSSATLILKQPRKGGTPNPNPEKPLLFVSNGTGLGNLTAPTSSGYQNAVYGLGENMRNSTKFGKGGSLANTTRDAFDYKYSMNSSTIADAKIIQLLSNPTSAEFDLIYKRLQADPTAFLMITSANADEVTKILAQFKAKTNAKYGTAVQLSNNPTRLRPVNTRLGNNKLMSYLLNGPGGTITAATPVQLQGAIQNSAGLPSVAYPESFVPIVMSTSDYYYCVFGIDPVNRLIILTDPGIFGASPRSTNYPSYKNFLFTGTINYRFLDNLTAWIFNATDKSSFLQNYK